MSRFDELVKDLMSIRNCSRDEAEVIIMAGLMFVHGHTSDEVDRLRVYQQAIEKNVLTPVQR